MKFSLALGVATVSLVCLAKSVLAEECCDNPSHHAQEQLQVDNSKQGKFDDGFDELIVPDFQLKDDQEGEAQKSGEQEGEPTFERPNLTPEEIDRCSKYTAEQMMEFLQSGDQSASQMAYACMSYISQDTMNKMIELISTDMEVPASSDAEKSTRDEEGEELVADREEL